MRALLRIFFLLIFASSAIASTPLVNVSLTGSSNQVAAGATLTVYGTLVVVGSFSGVQMTDAKLTSFVGLSPTSDTSIYFTDATHLATMTYTGFARSLAALSTRTAYFNAVAPASPATNNLLYFDGTNWSLLALGTGASISSGTLNITAGAPSTATFLTAAAESALPNSISLGTLSSGILKITVASSVASFAAATPGIDYLVPAAIGSTVEAWSANLDSWSAKTVPGGSIADNTSPQTWTNKALTSPTISSPTISSPTMTGTFAPPIVSSDPASPSNGMFWYNSTSGAAKMQIAGSTISLGGGGGTGNVSGAASSTTHNLVTFGDTTGKLIEDFSTITAASTGILTASAGIGLTSTGAHNIVLSPGTGLVQVGPYATAPSADDVFQASVSGGNAAIAIISFGGTTSGFRGFLANGTSASPTSTPSGAICNFLGGGGYTGSAWVGSRALIGEYAAENWTGSAEGAYVTFETTPTGSTTRAEAARVSPNGNLLVGATSDITGLGHLSVGSSEDSTSTSTGAVRVVGGIAVTKKIFSASTITGTQLISNISTGTAPLSVSSTTNVPNLNASSLNGATFAAPGAIGGTTASTGAFTTISATSSILSTSPIAGIGYATGAGGSVTQATSRTTGVTLNTVSGAITLVSAAGSTSYQTFTITDSAVAATDTINWSEISATDKYIIMTTAVAAGSFQVTFATTGGTTTEQPVFKFTVVKGANS